MKKIICLILSVMLSSIPALAVSAESYTNYTQQYITLSDIYSDTYSSNSVLDVESSDLTSTNNFTAIKEFVQLGGIIIVRNDTLKPVSFSDQLDMPIEVLPLDSDSNSLTEENFDAGIDIATLYYNYGDNIGGIYIINTNIPDDPEADNLIAEAVQEIRIYQDSHKASQATVQSGGVGTSLETINITATRQPKGKLSTKYEFFTVQNYNQRDYYTVKATINANPGCVLASSNSNYQSKYQVKDLKAYFNRGTQDLTVDAYGPYRTIKSSSYSVSVGGSFGKDLAAQLSSSFSYSRSIDDTDIEADNTTLKASWDVNLKKNAQKHTCTFEPAATFVCPYSKLSVNIELFASANFDSWNTFKEYVTINRTVKCTPTSAALL